MRIKALDIYGYGKFVERKIQFNNSLTEIFGENEAGKSTIQAFIHSILFGFPTKRENEPRFEPRLGNQYGGKLYLTLDDGQEIEVERVKGAAQGDVKVYLENGGIRDEEWLQKKLNYIDKSTYKGIYSFDVLGLQNINRNMDENQLQEYLLQAGALGSTQFTTMRTQLAERKNELYKRSGKNPIINQQVEQLNELENQIREQESNLGSYQRLIDEKDKAERRLNHLHQNLQQLSKMHEAKQKELALHDQAQEWKALEHELNIEPLDFPEQGIERYESSKQQNNQLKKDVGLRQEKLNQLKNENDQIDVPKMSDIDALNQIAKQEDEIKQLENDLKSVSKEIEEKEREIQSLKSNVGWKEMHDNVDVSESVKSYVSRQISDKNEQTSYITQLKRTLEEQKIEQANVQEEQEDVKNALVPDEVFEKKQQYNQQSFELKEKKNLYQKMKEAFDIEQQERDRKQKMLRITFVLLAIVGAGLAVFSFVTQALIFAIIFGIAAIGFIIGAIMVKSTKVGHSEAFSTEISQLEKQNADLESKYDLNFDLDEQHRLREQNHNIKKANEVLDNKIALTQEKLDEAKISYQQLEDNISEIKSDLHVSPKMTDSLILDGIKTIERIQVLANHLEQLKGQQKELQSKINEFYEHANRVTKNQITDYNQSSLFHDVKRWLKQAEDNHAKWTRNNESIDLLTKELSQLNTHLNENTNLIDKLFKHVKVDNEEAYYRYHNRYQTYQSNHSRYHDLNKYLENQNFMYDDASKLSDKTKVQLEDEKTLLAKQVDDYNDQFLTLQSEVSDLNAQIKHMETDDTLTQLRHRYHMLKNQFNENAKDWASLSYLEALVDAHIQQIKDKRLPQVIDEATNIFSRLTNGRYTQVTYANDNVMVKHENGQMYQPTEISQSTKELLYISLRLSLIKILRPYYSMPIIIDDAFVHFDKQRKAAMMDYLKEMAQTYQVLYFTCTKDNFVPTKQKVILEKIEEGGK
ncbi:AAA family ATPase [Staphylococcus carnosus]|uniref:DNA repair protein Rad50 n=2 Tax=Staphylococcus carnosus TaxID=1281 RepID=A0AAJ0JQ44_STACA|nr:AAA family ATPase [Staphylococcus carnosus]KKB25954.1 DNA repair protein Rad50 [Staphylococcus carnosus]QQS84917.1 AAA family ATPase [Staphylococcus carnosus]QRQ04856.1 AAA family ATPase [Staphylococcus carnosus]UTB83147.1 DNA repair protein Rad50 [Staphylococcus carnosus]UTC00201.1 DNA repair protein Rad50 [Staphylococcus carnosus]